MRWYSACAKYRDGCTTAATDHSSLRAAANRCARALTCAIAAPTGRMPRPSPSASGRLVTLSGICTASTPPCGSARKQPRQHLGMIGHPLEHGIAEQQIGARLCGSQVARSPSTKVRPAAVRAPARSMSGEESTPITSASETARSAIRWNCPARSRDRPRASDLRAAPAPSRSRGGRVRSSSNLRYWRADQSDMTIRLAGRWTRAAPGAPRLSLATASPAGSQTPASHAACCRRLIASFAKYNPRDIYR